MPFALIGCGHWGRNLARNLDALGMLEAVCDSDAEALGRAASVYPAVRHEADYLKVLAAPEVEAVLIATPAETHAALAEAALLAGKDVFVEKPLALRYEDGERLVRLAARLGRVLMVGHLLEYHPAVLRLQELIGQGELGRVRYAYSNRLNLGRVRREENILWSFAPHDIAVILRLLGELPFEVTSTGGAYLQPNLADVTVMNMLFDNGVRAHIFVSWLHPYKEHRLVVIGSKKMAVFDDSAERDKLVLYDQGVDWVGGMPLARRNGGTPVPYDAVEPLRAECEHFKECVRTRRAPRTSGENGLRVLRVLQAAQRSLMTQGQPVQVGQAQRLEVVNL